MESYSTKSFREAALDSRISKSNSIVSDFIALLDEFTFGQCKFQVEIKLREAMLFNEVLYKRESWHGLTDKQFKSLEAVDEYLFGSISKAHSKTPK